MAPQGAVCFLGNVLHPGALLLIWLAAMVAIQFADSHGLLAIMVCALLSSSGVWRKVVSYLRRTRWLFLSLWLIIAYNTPGDAYLDLSWLPTYEGVRDANLGALRLLVMLACLATVFVKLGQTGLQSGLWALLVPFRALGIDAERLVVRLALVMESVDVLPAKGEWKKMLGQLPAEEEDTLMSLEINQWRILDALGLMLAWGLLSGAVLL